ncbi:MAG: transposase [Tannerella sp.]|jgi:REP element-mobilizing transposase RayT|nr:transposase [Tannerella sp.]
MAAAYKISNQESAYFLTFRVVGWVDIFTRQIYRDIVIESLKYCQQHKGLILYAYVIMSNHVHMLAQSEDGSLKDVVRDCKHFTGSRILTEIEDVTESRRDWMKIVFEYHAKLKPRQLKQLWEHENHAEEIYSPGFFAQKINYIHENPVRAGIVENAEDYLYSSAKNYAGLSSEIEVTIIDLPWKTYR